MNAPSAPDRGPGADDAVEDVEVRGHIIDSLILPKVLDGITAAGGHFRIKDIAIGQDRRDPSFARIEVRAASEEALAAILAQIADHGAVPIHGGDARLAVADIDGAFPEGFYSSTNQRTEVRLGGHWLEVADQEMDCGIVVDASGRAPRCVAMSDVVRGMNVVVGHLGVRVFPLERQEQGHAFAFMNSAVSTEKPKGVIIREIARQLFANRGGPGQSLLVGGPAIVHTGSGPLVSELINGGYIHKLFAGNALATHDIEQALFGTSLGVNLREGTIVDAGHEHHLRAINRIRRAGSIAAAVESGLLRSGIMHDCVKQGVAFHLSGSIRDDGPLPDVVTDALECQRIMRGMVRDVTF
jgi:lysine-ketoglutarate reductase/saccharopine dehydrogenase-like protein (TIGR00300 family)